jgi:hypothetical protein
MTSRRFSLDNSPHQRLSLQYRAFSQVQTERGAPEQLVVRGRHRKISRGMQGSQPITSRTLGTIRKLSNGGPRKAMARMSHRFSGCSSTDPHQAAFFAPLTLAHLARCAAAIFRRAEADMVRLLGNSATPLTFAQRAL